MSFNVDYLKFGLDPKVDDFFKAPVAYPSSKNLKVHSKDYYITGRANVIFCAVGLR